MISLFVSDITEDDAMKKKLLFILPFLPFIVAVGGGRTRWDGKLFKLFNQTLHHSSENLSLAPRSPHNSYQKGISHSDETVWYLANIETSGAVDCCCATTVLIEGRNLKSLESQKRIRPVRRRNYDEFLQTESWGASQMPFKVKIKTISFIAWLNSI